MNNAKKIGKLVIKLLGFDIRRVSAIARPGSEGRPVGHMDLLLEDLQARGLRCSTILDVGANNTNWSRLALRIFPGAAVCMIEPQEEMKGHLDDFCLEHPASSYFLGGAGARAGTKDLTLWPDLAGSSFLPEPDPVLRSQGKQRTIEIKTIDQVLAEKKLPAPQLIKLDIQGYELEALKGAAGTFGLTEVYIVETSLYPFPDVPGIPLFPEVISFMKERNYAVYDFGGFLRRPLDGALAQCDVCFVKQNGFLRNSARWD